MIEAITRILNRCGSTDSVIPPTQLFNEGWMLRLVLDWFDRNREIHHPLSFAPDAKWYSEALLTPRFLPQSRADSRAESFTHADGVVGHFRVNSGVRGDAVILSNARQFIVIEAKLRSALSTGTKNAPDYDQAARNVACIAQMVGKGGLDPSAISQLAFYVVAPEEQIRSGLFANLVSKESIEAKVRARVASYDGLHDNWLRATFLPTLAHIQIGLLSWESIFLALPETAEIQVMRGFYKQCLKFNLPRMELAVGITTDAAD